DGKRLAVVEKGPSLSIWDVAQGKMVRRLAPRRGTSLLVWSPDGKVLATACDGGVQLWDTATGRRIGQCDNPANTQAHSLAFLADNKVLAAGTCGAAVRLWDVPSGRDLAPTGGHQNAVSGLAFSRDGKTLYSAGGDGVRLWTTATLKQRRHLQ